VGLGANLTRTLILFFVKDNIKLYPNEIICFFFVLYLQKKLDSVYPQEFPDVPRSGPGSLA
jgi:hypothetical protein